MKKIILKTFLFFLLLTILIVKPNVIKAQDSEVTCDGADSCTLSPEGPLFPTSQDNLWYPGKSIAKTLRITNSSTTNTLTISTNAQNSQTDKFSCQLDKQLLLSIVGPNGVSWAGSLNNFYQLSTPLPLGNFSPDSFGDFIFTVFLPQGTENQCQDRTTSFNLLLDFSGEPITPPPASTPTLVSGAVLGAGVSAPSCSDTKPGTPTSLTATILGAGSVRLSWASPPQPYTYFLIAYSNDPTTMKWGNPNVGNVTSYTVSGLGTGTYWFWLRAGNGCMPGDFVGPVSPGTIAGIAGAQTVAPGFTQGVLGVETQLPEAIPNPSATAQILGTECVKNKYPWWIFLVLELIAILLILRRGIIHKWRVGKLMLSLVTIAALSQIAHEITGCNCIISIWCSKYLLINLVILLFSTAYGLYRLSKKNK